MGEFNLGRTLSRTFMLIRDGFPSVGIFLLLAQLISGLSSYFMQGRLAEQMQQALAAGTQVAPAALFSSGSYWLTVAISAVLAIVIYTGGVHGYLMVERKAPISAIDCLTLGLRKFLPGLGLMILWGLGIGLGWVLFIVPGLMLMTMWSTAIPALVGENTGVIANFGRSRELTKGSRWPIFGTLLIALLIMYAPMIVFGGALAARSTVLLTGQTLSPLFMLGTLIYGWLVAMFINALLTSIYLDCRLAKEGVTSGQVSDIFA